MLTTLKRFFPITIALALMIALFAVIPPLPESIAETNNDTIDSLEASAEKVCQTTESNNCAITDAKTRVLLARIRHKISILAKKNLTLYALKKYGNASQDVRRRLAAAYVLLEKNDPKANVSPKYLLALGNRITTRTTDLDTDSEFLAYAFITLKLKETGVDMVTLQKKIDTSVKTAIEAIDANPKSASFSQEEATKLESIFTQVDKNPWNPGHIAMMRAEILRNSIPESTLYFQAYKLARMRWAISAGNLTIGSVPHTKQKYALSCEANSLTDLLNYYRKRSGKDVIDEDTLLLMLPTDASAPKLEKIGATLVRVWGDPDTEFVGSITGMQSSNPVKLTGYWVHADGIFPLAKQTLASLGITPVLKAFDEEEIIASLYKGDPVMFWYAAGSANKLSPSKLSWQTEGGKNITGYVGEHTGVIVGAEIDKNGHIKTLQLYEGLTAEVRSVPFEIVEREAKWFNTAIYITKS